MNVANKHERNKGADTIGKKDDPLGIVQEIKIWSCWKMLYMYQLEPRLILLDLIEQI